MIYLTILEVIWAVQFNDFFHGATVPSGSGSPHSEGLQSHSDTWHSVGLLWTSDDPDAKTVPENTKLSKEADIRAPGGIRTHDPSN